MIPQSADDGFTNWEHRKFAQPWIHLSWRGVVDGTRDGGTTMPPCRHVGVRLFADATNLQSELNHFLIYEFKELLLSLSWKERSSPPSCPRFPPYSCRSGRTGPLSRHTWSTSTQPRSTADKKYCRSERGKHHSRLLGRQNWKVRSRQDSPHRSLMSQSR